MYTTTGVEEGQGVTECYGILQTPPQHAAYSDGGRGGLGLHAGDSFTAYLGSDVKYSFLTGVCGRGVGFLVNELFPVQQGAVRNNCTLTSITHTPAGSAEALGRCFLIANRNIAAGEELGTWYGADYCRRTYFSQCHCPRPTCAAAESTYPPHTCTTTPDKECTNCVRQTNAMAAGHLSVYGDPCV